MTTGLPVSRASGRHAPSRHRDVVGYYTECASDFVPWSSAGNMHFGFCRPGMDWFDREALLAAMNDEVAGRLGLAAEQPARVIDLGCGSGATLRQVLESRPAWRGIGVTLAPLQVDVARRAAREARLNDRLTVLREDYRRLSFPARRFDGAWAIESSCYGCGYAKADFIREAARVLKPGAKLVVADVFFRDERPLPALLRQLHDRMCDGWELETLARLPSFLRALEARFDAVEVEDVSQRVAASLLHVPAVTARYLWSTSGRALTERQKKHLASPIFAALLGLARDRLGYFLITATRA